MWVVLVGKRQARGLNPKAEARWFTVKWLALSRRIDELELIEVQDTLVDPSRLWPAPTILIASPSGVTTSAPAA